MNKTRYDDARHARYAATIYAAQRRGAIRDERVIAGERRDDER